MPTPVLGAHNFSAIPTVNGAPVLLAAANMPRIVYSGNISRQTGTTVIPVDNTTPLSTEGTAIMTQVITPASAASKFLFAYNTDVGVSANSRVTIALFRGTTCLTSRTVYGTTTVQPQQLAISWVDAPTTTASITYSLRIGATAGTWTLNGSSVGTMGGTNDSVWTITELY